MVKIYYSNLVLLNQIGPCHVGVVHSLASSSLFRIVQALGPASNFLNGLALAVGPSSWTTRNNSRKSGRIRVLLPRPLLGVQIAPSSAHVALFFSFFYFSSLLDFGVRRPRDCSVLRSGDGRRDARGCGRGGVRGLAAGHRPPRRPLRVSAVRRRVWERS